MDPNLFGPKILLDPEIFGHKILFDTKLFWTQNFILPFWLYTLNLKCLIQIQRLSKLCILDLSLVLMTFLLIFYIPQIYFCLLPGPSTTAEPSLPKVSKEDYSQSTQPVLVKTSSTQFPLFFGLILHIHIITMLL